MIYRGTELSEDGSTLTIRKFTGAFSIAPYSTPKWLVENTAQIKTLAVLDLETTGTDYRTDTTIEIGLRLFKINASTGELVSLEESYSALQDPGKELDPVISNLTGLTNEDLEGKSIDWSHVDSLLSKTDLIIAHNAQFDRPFLEKNSTASKSKIWACSVRHVDWKKEGLGTAKLEILTLLHGFFVRAHRALEDADSLLHLLTLPVPGRAFPYMKDLVENAFKPMVLVSANKSPFESKDHLKFRGYRWNQAEKAWQKTIPQEILAPELTWLEGVVYRGPFLGQTTEISPLDLFKTPTQGGW